MVPGLFAIFRETRLVPAGIKHCNVRLLRKSHRSITMHDGVEITSAKPEGTIGGLVGKAVVVVVVLVDVGGSNKVA